MTPEELAAAGLRYDVAGPVATVSLARPEVHNAQTPEMWRALAAVGAEIPGEVRVVVVRGEGPSFSAGLDRAMFGSLTEMASLPDDQVSETIERFQAGFTWLRDPRFVSIAVVQGHAIGAGLQLALSCDLRVLGDDARLCMKEPALGLVPDLTGTKPLVDAVGYARALEMCATARTVGAAEALEIGLATLVCPVAELDAALADLVGALTAPRAGAVRETKALLQGAAGRSLDEQRRFEREAQIRRLHELGSTTCR